MANMESPFLTEADMCWLEKANIQSLQDLIDVAEAALKDLEEE